MSATTKGRPVPDVDHLTRDYRGIREQLIQLITRSGSRSSERSAADLGMVVLEALAYQLDHLAYAGDRVASEGFLRTARSRQSVRLHAALGDYVLDRGSTSVGFQHFNVATGTLQLPAGVTVGPRLEQDQSPDDRDLFATLHAVTADARRNRFTLRKSVGAGSRVLWLGGAEGEVLDLWTAGLRPGMPLALVSRDNAERVVVAAVQGSTVTLEHPCRSTFIAGGSDRAGHVVGNLFDVRRGRWNEWRALGRGGGARAELPPATYYRRRVALFQQLMEIVECHRSDWYTRNDLAYAWTSAQRSAALAVCQLRRVSTQALSDALADRIDELFGEAAAELRKILAALGLAVPAALLASSYVSIPRQRVALPPETAPLWLDDQNTLEVVTLVGGRTYRWTEVEDFLRSGPNDRHYVVEIVHDRDVALRFGDDVHGVMPPPGTPILARWVVGEPSLGDVGRDALVLAFDCLGQLDPEAPTSNPLATTRARPAEPIEHVADRLRVALATPAIPITRSDFVELFEQRLDVVEAAVLPTDGMTVRVAVRVARDADVGATLDALERWSETVRLVGSSVRLSLARPLYVSVTAIVQVHPEAEPAAVKGRCKAAVRAMFGAGDERRMGVSCTRSEVLRTLEGTIGVEWSQLVRFDRSTAQSPIVRETIVAAADELLRCLDDPEVDATGRVTILTACEYSLVAELHFDDRDLAPSDDELYAALHAALSGPDSLPRREGWDAITPARVAHVLHGAPFHGAHHRIMLRRLIRGDRSVDRILLRADDVPMLRSLQLMPLRVQEIQNEA
jgi:hypothetical protein